MFECLLCTKCHGRLNVGATRVPEFSESESGRILFLFDLENLYGMISKKKPTKTKLKQVNINLPS